MRIFSCWPALEVGLAFDVRVFPAIAEAVEQDQVHRQAQLGLVLVSFVTGIFSLGLEEHLKYLICCRVGKGVNLGQVVFVLRALNVLW